jgi:hypothetical protein
MRVTVSYHARDIYDIPDESWRKAMALCGDDEDNAFDSLMDGSDGFLCSSDATDRYVEVERE